MKASVEWLKEYSDIPVDIKTLADILTMTGSKVETIESRGEDIKNVVVGKILEINKHPDADKLIVTKVDVGNEKLQIVTGANNVKVGDIVPIAKDGSSLPGGVKIKTGKLRRSKFLWDDVCSYRTWIRFSKLSRSNRTWNYDITTRA